MAFSGVLTNIQNKVTNFVQSAQESPQFQQVKEGLMTHWDVRGSEKTAQQWQVVQNVKTLAEAPFYSASGLVQNLFPSESRDLVKACKFACLTAIPTLAYLYPASMPGFLCLAVVCSSVFLSVYHPYGFQNALVQLEERLHGEERDILRDDAISQLSPWEYFVAKAGGDISLTHRCQPVSMQQGEANKPEQPFAAETEGVNASEEKED